VSDSAAQCSEVAFFALVVHFTVFWSAFVLFFDCFMYVRHLLEQSRTFRFAAVEGKVLKCEEKMEEDHDGNPHSNVGIEYGYRVDNQDYKGTRIRYPDYWNNLGVAEFVAAHPAGEPVTVYYDPDDPADAVLQSGFDGRELYLPLMFLPFNVIMFGLWCLTVAGFRNRGRGWSKPYDGIRMIAAEGKVRIRLPGLSPAAAGLFALVVTPIPVVLFMGFCLGMPTDLGVAACAWIVVLASFVVVYRYAVKRADSGKYDLVIDYVEQTLTLPQKLLGSETVIIPLCDLLVVDMVSKVEPEQGRLYTVSVQWRNAGGELLTKNLAVWFALEQTQEHVKWIRENTELAHSLV
jgi:hypothetical protein